MLADMRERGLTNLGFSGASRWSASESFLGGYLFDRNYGNFSTGVDTITAAPVTIPAPSLIDLDSAAILSDALCLVMDDWFAAPVPFHDLWNLIYVEASLATKLRANRKREPKRNAACGGAQIFGNGLRTMNWN